MVAKWLVLPTLNNEVTSLNPAGGNIQLVSVPCFIAQSLSSSPFHHLDITSIMLKGTEITKSSSSSYLELCEIQLTGP